MIVSMSVVIGAAAFCLYMGLSLSLSPPEPAAADEVVSRRAVSFSHDGHRWASVPGGGLAHHPDCQCRRGGPGAAEEGFR